MSWFPSMKINRQLSLVQNGKRGLVVCSRFSIQVRLGFDRQWVAELSFSEVSESIVVSLH